jgi:hypothetical protein
MWDLVQKFNHMKKVILGTRFVDVQYQREYPDSGERLPGIGIQCQECWTGFRYQKKQVDKGQVECPACHHSVSVI